MFYITLSIVYSKIFLFSNPNFFKTYNDFILGLQLNKIQVFG